MKKINGYIFAVQTCMFSVALMLMQKLSLDVFMCRDRITRPLQLCLAMYVSICGGLKIFIVDF